MTGVLIVVVIILVLTLIAKSRRSAPLATPAPSSMEELPEAFRIVTLGTRGSGKTLFLASMFHELQTFRGRSYYVNAPHDQVITLTDWFSQIEDTDRAFPSGTSVGATRTFNFELMTKTSSNRMRKVLEFDYLEYAGGLLTDAPAPGSTAHEQISTAIRQAHALICIIDGSRIRQLFDGEPGATQRLGSLINAMLTPVLNAQCPVTFIVTKWDLLHDIEMDDDLRLNLVAKSLMYHKGFNDLVQHQSSTRIVRLIPVSAIGDEFADLTDGRVAKRSEGKLHPTNVDVPLAAVVPDIFEQLEQDIEAHQSRAEAERLRNLTRLGPAAAAAELGLFLSNFAGTAWAGVSTRTASFVGDAAFELFRRSDGTTREVKQQAIDAHVDASVRDLQEFRIARRRVLRELRRRVDVLEGHLPNSRLSPRE